MAPAQGRTSVRRLPVSTDPPVSAHRTALCSTRPPSMAVRAPVLVEAPVPGALPVREALRRPPELAALLERREPRAPEAAGVQRAWAQRPEWEVRQPQGHR